MKKGSLPASQGPFRADQIRPGDPYELSHGHRKAVVEVLAARGLAVDDELRDALAGVRKVEALESLLRQAATASSPAEVLAAVRG